MQQLHLVGMTTDLEGLIFSVRKGAKSGSFVVPLDDQVLATITETLRRREVGVPGGASGASSEGPSSRTAQLLVEAAGGRGPRPESHLSPREIQARLRAGRSVEDVAREAGVDAEWVDRFAPPVRAEQGRVVERALTLSYVRPRQGESSQPLGSAVRWNLFDKGVRLSREELDEGWDAYQVHDTVWVVRFRYRSRGREQAAEWEVDLAEGRLSALNRVASQLAYVERGRRRRPPALDAPAPAAPAAPAAGATAAPAGAAKASKTSKAAKSAKAGRARKSAPALKAAPTRKAGAKASATVRPAPAGGAAKKKATTRTTKAASVKTARPAKSPATKAPAAKTPPAATAKAPPAKAAKTPKAAKPGKAPATRAGKAGKAPRSVPRPTTKAAAARSAAKKETPTRRSPSARGRTRRPPEAPPAVTVAPDEAGEPTALAPGDITPLPAAPPPNGDTAPST